MKKNANISLVGFMGAGKTVVSQKLASMFQRERVSTDDLIVKKEKREISDIFRDEGEAYFREKEKEVIESLKEQSGLVIDCGGGVVLRDENIANLKQNGALIYLSASPDVIFERVKDETHRPLLNVSDPKAKIEKLLNDRMPFYQKADHTLDTNNKTVDDICQEIVELIS